MSTLLPAPSADETTSNILPATKMSNTTSSVIIEGLCIAGIAVGLISLYQLVKSSLSTPEIEKSEPKVVARKRAPIIHIGFEQAHEFAAADALVDGDLVVEGGDVYRVRRDQIPGDGLWITYERCYSFDE